MLDRRELLRAYGRIGTCFDAAVRSAGSAGELAEPLRPPDRAVPAGRRHRRDRARDGGEALGDLGPSDGRREPAAAPTPTSASEIVARAEPDGYTVLLHSMPLAVNKFLFDNAALRPGRRFRAGQPDLRLSQRDGGAGRLAVKDGAGVHRARQGQSGQADLCVVRPRHLGASLRRAVQAARQGRHAARALSRRGAGAERSHSRPRRRDVQQHRRGDAADPDRQAARARRHHV